MRLQFLIILFQISVDETPVLIDETRVLETYQISKDLSIIEIN